MLCVQSWPKRRETRWQPALLWHHPVGHSQGGISTDSPEGGSILLALLLGQLLRVHNPPASPVPPLTPVACHPIEWKRFPSASLGCGKRKLPAVRHLPTPPVDVFRLLAAPRVGCGVLLSHMLLGWPHRDPHSATQ